MSKPLAIDLFCGLGGWAEGLLAEGWEVIGFDIERHEYAVPDIQTDENGGKGTKPIAKRGWTQGCAISLGMEGANNRPRTKLLKYPGQLVIQDVRTLHGSQFKSADLIVASPPCQEYSYMAMPWKRAKAKAAAIRADATGKELERLNELFNACFRIQREASEAAGYHIPLVVENVRVAIPWVGRSRWNFGSFHLWGDVPALMPSTIRGFHPRLKTHQGEQWNINRANYTGTQGWREEIKNNGGSWFNIAHNTTSGKGNNPDGRKAPSGTQWFNDGPRPPESLASSGSKSPARKAASAMIAKIPLPLARHIAATFKPQTQKAAA